MRVVFLFWTILLCTYVHNLITYMRWRAGESGTNRKNSFEAKVCIKKKYEYLF